MPSDSDTLRAIAKTLESIDFALGDLNPIRNGEYDPPRGADGSKHPRTRAKTLDDVHEVLLRILSEQETQTEMLHDLVVAVVDEEADDGDE